MAKDTKGTVGRPRRKVKVEEHESPIRPIILVETERPTIDMQGNESLVRKSIFTTVAYDSTNGFDIISEMASGSRESWIAKFQYLKRKVISEQRRAVVEVNQRLRHNNSSLDEEKTIRNLIDNYGLSEEVARLSIEPFFACSDEEYGLEEIAEIEGKLKKIDGTERELKERLSYLDSLRQAIEVAELYLKMPSMEADKYVNFANTFFKIGVFCVLTGIHYFPDAEGGKNVRKREKIAERERHHDKIRRAYEEVEQENPGISLSKAVDKIREKYKDDYSSDSLKSLSDSTLRRALGLKK